MSTHMHSPARDEEQAVDLATDIATMVREHIGIKEPLATMFAQMLVEGLRSRLGGEQVYIPKLRPDREARDAAIRAEFNGSNLADVCKKYGVSKSLVYVIVNKGKKRRPG